MLTETSPSTPAAKPAATRGKSICQVLSALDASDALSRAQNEAVQEMVKACLDHGEAAVFIWGGQGMALLTTLENPHDGRFAFVSWYQAEPGVPIKEVLPTFKRWGENQGATRLAAAVERSTPEAWEKLTDMTLWKVVIACEL